MTFIKSDIFFGGYRENGQEQQNLTDVDSSTPDPDYNLKINLNQTYFNSTLNNGNLVIDQKSYIIGETAIYSDSNFYCTFSIENCVYDEEMTMKSNTVNGPKKSNLVNIANPGEISLNIKSAKYLNSQAYIKNENTYILGIKLGIPE